MVKSLNLALLLCASCVREHYTLVSVGLGCSSEVIKVSWPRLVSTKIIEERRTRRLKPVNCWTDIVSVRTIPPPVTTTGRRVLFYTL